MTSLYWLSQFLAREESMYSYIELERIHATILTKDHRILNFSYKFKGKKLNFLGNV
jgi:hypothetical protein